MKKSEDQLTSVEELKTLVRQFCEARDWDQFHNPKDLAIGLVTEASELLEIFRFRPEVELARVVDERREAIADELADSLYCLLRFAQLYKFDLSECLREKLAKNELKYPAHQ